MYIRYRCPPPKTEERGLFKTLNKTSLVINIQILERLLLLETILTIVPVAIMVINNIYYTVRFFFDETNSVKWFL